MTSCERPTFNVKQYIGEQQGNAYISLALLYFSSFLVPGTSSPWSQKQATNVVHPVTTPYNHSLTAV